MLEYVGELARGTSVAIVAGTVGGILAVKYLLDRADPCSGYNIKKQDQRTQDANIRRYAFHNLVEGNALTDEQRLFLESMRDHPEYEKAVRDFDL